MSKPASPPYETTLATRDACMGLHVRRAARAVGRRFDDALRPLGITGGQFSLLMSLNRPVPPTIGEAAAPLGMDRTTLTANLKPLQRDGLVEVAVDEQDKRGRRLRLTADGRTMLRRAVPVWQRTNAEIEALLGDIDADAVRAALRALS